MRVLPKSSSLLVASAATALGLVGGAGFAMAQDSTAPATPATSAVSAADAQSPHQQRDAALAQKLGVSEQQVHDAFASMRAAQDVAQDEQKDPAEALAQALGKQVYEVRDAMDSLREDREKQRRDDLSSRLDAAVTAGKISSADKDSILKGFDAGVLEPQHAPHDGQQTPKARQPHEGMHHGKQREDKQSTNS